MNRYTTSEYRTKRIEVENQVIELYQSGIKTSEIEARFPGTNYQWILKKHGIKRNRPRNSGRSGWKKRLTEAEKQYKEWVEKQVLCMLRQNLPSVEIRRRYNLDEHYIVELKKQVGFKTKYDSMDQHSFTGKASYYLEPLVTVNPKPYLFEIRG